MSRLSVSLVLAFVLMVPHTSLNAQSFRCPDGTMSRPATEAEANADGGGAGIIAGVTQHCPTIGAAAGISAEAGQAKQQLESMWCGNRAARCGPYVSSINQLDPKFAVCAARFMQQVRQRDRSICIVSAYRSTEHQAALCSGRVCGAVNGPCAAAGQSKHQSGRALDISKPGTTAVPTWVHQMAQQGSGVSFPVRGDSGHMEPANVNANDCATAGFIAPGNSGGPTTPTGGLANSLRNLFGMQQQPMMQQPMSSQPLQQQQSPLGAFNQTPQPTLQPVSGSIGTPSSPTSTKSVADQLLDIAKGTTTVTYSTTTTASTAPIVITRESAGTIVSVTYSSSSQQYGTGSLQPVGQQTFSSGDAGLQQPIGTPTVTSRLIQLYTALRDVLARILEIVRPFGGSRGATQYFE